MKTQRRRGAASSSPQIRALMELPGVGISIAHDLLELGIQDPSDLRGKDPQRLYDRFCSLRGMHIDRCLLYVFRCAVYAVETPRPNPKLLKWWNWKDIR